MSEVIRLATKKRPAGGTNSSVQLRKRGEIPAILYGHKQDALMLSLDATSLERALEKHLHFLELDVDGRVETALLQEVQYDVFGQEVLHADFLRVDIDEPIVVSIGLEFRGHPKGVSEGGVFEHFMVSVRIKCAPRNMPDVIEVGVADLLLHQAIQLKDLKLPAGASLVDDANKSVCAVVANVPVAAAPVAATEGEPAAPEVIGKKKEETPEEE